MPHRQSGLCDTIIRTYSNGRYKIYPMKCDVKFPRQKPLFKSIQYHPTVWFPTFVPQTLLIWVLSPSTHVWSIQVSPISYTLIFHGRCNIWDATHPLPQWCGTLLQLLCKLVVFHWDSNSVLEQYTDIFMYQHVLVTIHFSMMILHPSWHLISICLHQMSI